MKSGEFARKYNRAGPGAGEKLTRVGSACLFDRGWDGSDLLSSRTRCREQAWLTQKVLR